MPVSADCPSRHFAARVKSVAIGSEADIDGEASTTTATIAFMVRASIQAYLPGGYTTVGFEVHVKHFGATPKGKKVTVRAELLEIDGRKLRFRVEAHDEDKKVGDGTHRRAIIAVQREG